MTIVLHTTHCLATGVRIRRTGMRAAMTIGVRSTAVAAVIGGCATREFPPTGRRPPGGRRNRRKVFEPPFDSAVGQSAVASARLPRG